MPHTPSTPQIITHSPRHILPTSMTPEEPGILQPVKPPCPTFQVLPHLLEQVVRKVRLYQFGRPSITSLVVPSRRPRLPVGGYRPSLPREEVSLQFEGTIDLQNLYGIEEDFQTRFDSQAMATDATWPFRGSSSPRLRGRRRAPCQEPSTWLTVRCLTWAPTAKLQCPSGQQPWQRTERDVILFRCLLG